MNTRPTAKQLFVGGFVGVLLVVCDVLIQSVQLPPVAGGAIGALAFAFGIGYLSWYGAVNSTHWFPGLASALWLGLCFGHAVEDIARNPEYALAASILAAVFSLPAVYGIWWSVRQPTNAPRNNGCFHL